MTAPGCPKHKSEPSGCAGRRPAASFTRHPDSDRLADSLWRGIGGTRSARGRTVTWNWDWNPSWGKTSRGRRRLPSLTSHRHAPGNTWAVGDGNSPPVNKGPEHGGGWGTRILHHLPHTNVVSPPRSPDPLNPGFRARSRRLNRSATRRSLRLALRLASRFPLNTRQPQARSNVPCPGGASHRINLQADPERAL